jgi:Cu(I)/Ag(I) efflux system membrane fusion protein
MKQAAAPVAPASGVVAAATLQAAVLKPVVTPVVKKVVGNPGRGVLNAINGDGSVSITHGPIATLGWPGMTMDFALANASLAAGIKPGSKISFEIVERAPDEWVIIKLQLQK